MNRDAYQQTIWTLVLVLVTFLVATAFIWNGIQKILLQPLKMNIAHIRRISEGDLTQPVLVEGRNEMAQLAENLRDMQQSLVRTVSDVRDGSDAIYTRASEISAGNNDLFTHRAAGSVAGANCRQHGTVNGHREAEC